MAKIVSVTPNHGARGTEVTVRIQGTDFEPRAAAPAAVPAKPQPEPAAPARVPAREGLGISGGDVTVSNVHVSPTLVTAVLTLPAAPALPLIRDVTYGGETLEGAFLID